MESTRILSLQNGRKVSLSLCGNPSGVPVFFLHPLQGNRNMALALHKAANVAGLRIIAPDRPSIGSSTPLDGRTVQSYCTDLAELADQLQAPCFGLMAVSAGAMYALAATLAPQTAHRVRGRVTLLAPWLPHSSRGSGASPGLLSMLVTWTPLPLLRAAVGWSNSRIAQQALSLPVTQLMTRATAEERAAFDADAANDAAFKAMIAEWGSSLPGIVQEMALCSERDGPLHFSYQDVGVPLRVYAGTADAIVPHAAIAEWVRRANASEASGSNSDAPRVQFVSVPGGTHDGLIHTHKGDALEALAADLVGPG